MCFIAGVLVEKLTTGFLSEFIFKSNDTVLNSMSDYITLRESNAVTVDGGDCRLL